MALGKSPAIKRFAGRQTREVELGGRTVIPGLIDSHMDAIPWGTELWHRGALVRYGVD